MTTSTLGRQVVDAHVTAQRHHACHTQVSIDHLRDALDLPVHEIQVGRERRGSETSLLLDLHVLDGRFERRSWIAKMGQIAGALLSLHEVDGQLSQCRDKGGTDQGGGEDAHRQLASQSGKHSRANHDDEGRQTRDIGRHLPRLCVREQTIAQERDSGRHGNQQRTQRSQTGYPRDEVLEQLARSHDTARYCRAKHEPSACSLFAIAVPAQVSDENADVADDGRNQHPKKR